MILYVEYLDEKCGPLEYHTDGACGLDLRAGQCYADYYGQPLDLWMIEPGEQVLIPCGVKVAIPSGYDGEVALRSSIALNKQLRCFDGKIDSDYRDQIFVCVENVGKSQEYIEYGERFAQLIIRPHAKVRVMQLREGQKLEEEFPTERGLKGFGSTGS